MSNNATAAGEIGTVQDLYELGRRLEALAAGCAQDRRYDFFLTAQALRIVGGCGSPVNPIAVK